MGLFSFLGALSPVHINLVTLLSRAKKIGTDQCGNRYFAAPARAGYNHERRWVLYKGAPEATKVPPEWHGWLHYQSDSIPSSKADSFRRSWQKPHQQNMTGSTLAWRPQGHLLSGGKRPKATGDYQAWSPPES